MRELNSRVKSRRATLLVCLLVCAFYPQPTRAEAETPKIVCRAALSNARRAELSAQLRAITGWTGLHFDGEGALRFGTQQPSGGSRSARELLSAAQKGNNLLILEEASGRASRILEKAERNCLISNSISSTVLLEHEILVESAPEVNAAGA